jgi:hypothetical protein
MLTMIYMTRIQNMSFFLLIVNNPSVHHPIWPLSGTPSRTLSGPCRASRLAPSAIPSGPPSGPRQAPRQVQIYIYIFILFYFGCCCRLENRGKNISVFSFQSPRFPSSSSFAGFAGEAARRRRFFRPSSPSHPSKLYSSLGWLNSKVPKPFFPFTLRLIDVDGF